MSRKFFSIYNRIITAAADDCQCGGKFDIKRPINGKYGVFYSCKQCGKTISDAKYKSKLQEDNQNKQEIKPQDADKKIEQPIIDKKAPAGDIWWVLAKFLDTGKPVVLTKTQTPIGNVWSYRTEDNKTGMLPELEIKTKVQSIVDAKNQKITSKNPADLFKKFKEMNKEIAAEEEDIKEEPKKEDKAKDEEAKDKGEKKKHEPSEYQKAITKSFEESKQNIMVNALAGTGKTTTLLQLASMRKPGEKWVYVVFNKKNQIEGDKKFKKFGIPVFTVHSFLNTILKKGAENGAIQYTTDYLPKDIQDKNKNLKKSQQFLIEQKLWKIVDISMDKIAAQNPAKAIPKTDHFTYERGKYFIRQLTSLSQSYSIVPGEPDNADKIISILHSHSIPPKLITKEEAAKARINYDALPDYSEYMAASVSAALYYLMPQHCPEQLKAYENYRSFDDTLWFASINNNLDFSGYDVALVDEVQDFNLCQINMLKKMSDAGTRIIAVGDPNQSIYRFRGADSKSFERVAETLNAAPLGGVTHALPVNYRSGKAIIEYVRDNTHVKDIVAGLTHEGSVQENIEYDSVLQKLSTEAKKDGLLEEETAILARTNAPLAVAAVDLLQGNVDFEVVGTDFAKEAQEFLQECGLTDRMLVTDIYPTVEGYVDAFVRENQFKAALGHQCKNLQSWKYAILAILRWLYERNFKDPSVGIYEIENVYHFKNYLYRKFSATEDGGQNKFKKQKDPKSYVTLTTAHRSKGLEFDRVIIAEPGGFPSPQAKSKEDLAQEENAWYVALTRAKNNLILMDPRPEKYEFKKAKNMNIIGWYKKAQVLTPQQMQQYVNFKAPGAVKLIGSGMSAMFNIPGIGASIRGGQLMNQVLMKIQPVLTRNNVHTIDTSPVSRADAIGLAVSSEPGVIHVDIAKILKSIQNQALPPITQLDGAKIDQDVKNNILDKISAYIMSQLAETAAHESKHNIDYFASFPKGKFESQESAAESYGKGVAQQYFRMQ
jgi:superfamily I DNA/RNA helicase